MDLNSSSVNKNLGVIVCADDFGISSGVNDAIIKLLKNKRISAVSCLASGKEWVQGGPLLRDYRGVVDIGLHLSYGDMPFHKFLLLAYAKRVNKKLIFENLKSQLDCFMQSMGMPPDYIDGHQHIHQLPVFRSAVIELINTVKLHKIYVRNSAINFNDILMRNVSILKNIFIALPGAFLKRNLYLHSIPTNNDFLGIYNLNTTQEPGEIFEKILRTVKKPNSILMIHPSSGNKFLDGKGKAFDKNRVKELKYFESNAYKETLDRNGLYLSRFTFYKDQEYV